MPTFITPVDVSPGTWNDDTWTEVDVSAEVTASTVGVFLYYRQTGATGNNVAGWQKNGSTDNRTAFLDDSNGSCGAFVGVDDNGIFEIYSGDTANTTIFLLGYVEDSEGYFLDNAVDKAPGTADSYQEIDISGDTTTAGTADGEMAFFDVTAAGRDDIDFRVFGSTDGEQAGRVTRHSGACIGLSSEKCEVSIDNTSDGIWLVGWLTDNVTVLTDRVDESFSATGSWVDIASIGTDVGAAYVAQTSGATNATCGVRPNGSSLDLRGCGGGESRQWIISGATSGVLEAYRSSTAGDYLARIATFQEPSGGTAGNVTLGGVGTTATAGIVGAVGKALTTAIAAATIASAGIPTPSVAASVELLGAGSSASAGIVTPTALGAGEVTLVGQSAASNTGTLTTSGAALQTLTGAQSNTSSGTPTVTGAGVTTVTGETVTSGIGTLVTTGAGLAEAAGADSTASAGTVTALSAGQGLAQPVGVQASSAAGLVVPIGQSEGAETVTGVTVTSGIGTLETTTGAILTLTGASAQSAAGLAEGMTSAVLAGAGVASQAGILTPIGAAIMVLDGINATSAVGTAIAAVGKGGELDFEIDLAATMHYEITVAPLLDFNVTHI